MQRGQVVRFEEVTRCAAEVQDALISILSEQQIVIPELGETIQARRGFAVIATANTRDRGVNEMSAALKRRFNFVTIPVIADLDQEAEIVERRSRETLAQLGAAPTSSCPRELVRLLTTVFAELRRGQTLDGPTKLQVALDRPQHRRVDLDRHQRRPDGLLLRVRQTDRPRRPGQPARRRRQRGPNDLAVLRDYLETAVKPRTTGLWPELYAAGRELL